MEIEVQISRIAHAFERIADSIERIEAEGLTLQISNQSVLKIDIADIDQLNDQYFHVKLHK